MTLSHSTSEHYKSVFACTGISDLLRQGCSHMFTFSGSVRTLPAEGLGPNVSGIIGSTTLPAVLQLSGSHIAVMSPLFAKGRWGILCFSFMMASAF